MTAAYQPCVMPDPMCGCEWLYLPMPWKYATVYRHGDDPEHTREFTDMVVRDSEYCERGHIRIVEEWIAQVTAYAHPVAAHTDSPRD